MVDGNTKSMFIDDREPVERILTHVAAHIGMKHSDEFGLRRQNDKSMYFTTDCSY